MTTRLPSGLICIKTPPNALSEASVCSTYGNSGSLIASTGAVVIAFLRSSKALSQSSVQKSDIVPLASFHLSFMIDVNGAARSA